MFLEVVHLSEVFKYLRSSDLRSSALVCKDWYQKIKEMPSWHERCEACNLLQFAVTHQPSEYYQIYSKWRLFLLKFFSGTIAEQQVKVTPRSTAQDPYVNIGNREGFLMHLKKRGPVQERVVDGDMVGLTVYRAYCSSSSIGVWDTATTSWYIFYFPYRQSFLGLRGSYLFTSSLNRISVWQFGEDDQLPCVGIYELQQHPKFLHLGMGSIYSFVDMETACEIGGMS